jgi:hypothetical protein
MKAWRTTGLIACAMAGTWAGNVSAFPFEYERWTGALDSQLTAGLGIRLLNPNCGLVGDTSSSCGTSANTSSWSAGDNGNLNFKKGQLFTGYVKFTSELIAHDNQDGIDFLARATELYDPAAGATQRTELSQDAREQVVHNFRLLDLWVGKKFTVGDNAWRLRGGRQVLNWGESLYLYGGINATNAIDYQKSLIPGTQIKEFVLPAPMLSLAGQLGNGWNMEAYYQFGWNPNLYAPIGGYWSTADFLGNGYRDPFTFNTGNYNATGLDPANIAHQPPYSVNGRVPQGLINQINSGLLDGTQGVAAGILSDGRARNQGQFGISFHDKAPGSAVDYGLYFIRYHDKSPVFNVVGEPYSQVSGGIDYRADYLENRLLFGASTNFQVGQWAFGGELSFRPKDAVALSGCFTPGAPLDANINFNPLGTAAAGGNCPLYKDEHKWETHLTGQMQLQPSETPWLLNTLHADSGFITWELVGTYYQGVSDIMTQQVNGVTVAQAPQAGYIVWLTSPGVNGIVEPKGTSLSTGGLVDFNFTYDGTLLSGWQVTPGVTYFRAISGYTPNIAATYLKGAQSLNFYLLLNQNPAVWQAGLNYTTFFGGDEPSVMPYRDRDLIGAFVTYNF